MKYVHTLCRDKKMDTIKTLKETNEIHAILSKYRLPL